MSRKLAVSTNKLFLSIYLYLNNNSHGQKLSSAPLQVKLSLLCNISFTIFYHFRVDIIDFFSWNNSTKKYMLPPPSYPSRVTDPLTVREMADDEKAVRMRACPMHGSR
jgi:hypothetical protein